MLRFIDLETPPNREEDVQIAGLKPLPINRMVRQAGREANQFYTRGEFGSPLRNRNGEIFRNSDGTPQKGSLRVGPMPDDMKQRLIERQQRTKDAINNWDPIEASAQEDYNRLRGGNKPIVNPGALPLADELIQTIETPIAPATSQMDRYGI